MHRFHHISSDLEGRDAQLRELKTALSLAKLRRDKTGVSDLERKVSRCAQSSDPVSFGKTRSKRRR